MYLKKSDLYYSVLYGSGLYSLTSGKVTDPINGEESVNFSNVLFSESFFSRSLGRELGKEELEHYKRLVLSPPDIKNMLWPSDIVELGKKQIIDGVEKLDNIYAYDIAREKISERDYIFLFKNKNYPQTISLEEQLDLLEQRYGGGLSDRSKWQNYRNTEILSLAKGLVEKIDKLNRDGYLYLDFHPSRIRVAKSEIYLDFTNLIYDMEDIYNSRVYRPEYEKLPIEYTEPELYKGQKKGIDFSTQNYSLASVLFYLLVGRHAYDGLLRAADIDDSSYNHYIKFEKMTNNPIFIFDDKDKANHPGHEAKDEALLERWNTYPEAMRNMFTMTLARKVEHGKDVSYRYQGELPTPKQWYDLLCAL